MDNLILKNEAVKISRELIKIYESNKSLDKVFHDLLDKKYAKYDMIILAYIPNSLYDEGYTLESVDPFKLKEI